MPWWCFSGILLLRVSNGPRRLRYLGTLGVQKLRPKLAMIMISLPNCSHLCFYNNTRRRLASAGTIYIPFLGIAFHTSRSHRRIYLTLRYITYLGAQKDGPILALEIESEGNIRRVVVNERKSNCHHRTISVMESQACSLGLQIAVFRGTSPVEV